jgi:superfamily II DNA or RNA helicase/HKD family nuclease
MTTPLHPGIYERLVDAALRGQLDAQSALTAEVRAIEPADAPHVLARHMALWLQRALAALPDAEKRLELCHEVFASMERAVPKLQAGDEAKLELNQLLSLVIPDPLSVVAPPLRPGLPLSELALLVNARGEHRIGDEIEREMASADRVDLLCAFLIWSGYVRMKSAFEKLLRDRQRPLRILTTAYCGATERRVLDELSRMGAEIRISYDTRRTRLHAKAWLFQRETGFHTAYVGSSNLSAPALTEGLEWNVRLSSVESASVLEKFRTTFESYWQDGEFEPYDENRDAARFDMAIQAERGGPSNLATLISNIDVRPYDYQRLMLEQLNVERRVHGRFRNLVVAATGTGKTVLAALDYRREVQNAGRPLRLLFVAHRKEILTQSQATFRQVMRDGNFGGLYVDGERPQPGQSVFASIQSLARLDLNKIAPDSWDFVVIDEFHHAAADTYTKLLTHLTPRFLVGLTATPERADGEDILHFFGGRIATELRLWDAIDRNLLSPFQYFGLADGVDISQCWRRGQLDMTELDNVFSAHNARAHRILSEVATHVLNPRKMRALGFCVGKSHARFMAREFERKGLPAMALTSETPSEERAAAIRKLNSGEICALFTVDLFNEGVDVPAIDTVLMLRPTDSATIFLQQLGRGLRLSENKSCLTVLDFIGHAHREFRFDVRYRALLGGTRQELVRQIDDGFPILPAGCSIRLAPDAAKILLSNLKEALSTRTDRLVRELHELGAQTTLEKFLEHTRLELGELYTKNRTFTSLRRAAGLPTLPAGPDEAALSRNLVRMLHNDDPRLLDTVLAQIGDALQPRPTGLEARIWSTALVTLLGEDAVLNLPRALAQLWAHPAIRAELGELFKLLRDRVAHVPVPFAERPDVALQLHCRYSGDQIIAAFHFLKNGKMAERREGVLFEEKSNCDLLFVTLQKTEAHYSPSTMYQDCALSPELFQWETQSITTPQSVRGQRNLRHREMGILPLLFVRERQKDDGRETVAFAFLGPANLVRHEGERPIRIVWELKTPMPADFYREARVAA